MVPEMVIVRSVKDSGDLHQPCHGRDVRMVYRDALCWVALRCAGIWKQHIIQAAGTGTWRLHP
jgi:hypothetical protein